MADFLIGEWPIAKFYDDESRQGSEQPAFFLTQIDVGSRVGNNRHIREMEYSLKLIDDENLLTDVAEALLSADNVNGYSLKNKHLQKVDGCLQMTFEVTVFKAFEDDSELMGEADVNVKGEESNVE